MDQTTTNSKATGGNPVDHSGLCLLSLDRGGVRGLSTLQILKSIMTRLNNERSKSDLPALKPCEVFDLIGGTSTGGLIAIMLGRLEMDVDACITAYNKLIKAVFEDKLHVLPFGFSGRTKPQFDSEKLKKAVKEVITSQGFSPSEKFNDGKRRGCRVFVCTAAKDLYGITRLRSYDLLEKSSISATICEAALATSAATRFFDPVSIGPRQFVDGALGVNNPVEEVEGEASDIWCTQTGDLKPLVKCFISIGTGNPGKKAIEDKALKFLSKTLVAITTETEVTAQRFIARWRQHYDENRYFRLNVEQGLQDVGLEEYKDSGKIANATDSYLDDQAQIFRIRDCVQNLKQKQNRARHTLAQQIREFQTNLPRGRIPHKHWQVPRSPNPLFTGRDTILTKLENTITAAISNPLLQEQSRIVITGLGGQGKSEICLQLVHRLRKLFWGVFWVDVTTLASASADFLAIARQIEVSAEKWQDVRQALANAKDNWLLVLDNADDPNTDYGQYFPAGMSSVSLLTSRNSECKRHTLDQANHIVLEELADIDAQALLLDAAEVPHDQHAVLAGEAQAIAVLLQSHPLALIQAGSYIAQGYCSLRNYPAIFKERRNRLLNFSPTQNQSVYRNVYATFEVSADKLSASATEHANDALDLLSLLAICASRILPVTLFEGVWEAAQIPLNGRSYFRLDAWHISQLPSFIGTDSGTWNSFRLMSAINELKRFSLISTNCHQGNPNILTHPLIHAWAMDRMHEKERQHQAWIATGCIFAFISDGLWVTHARQLQSHIQELLSHGMDRIFASTSRAKIIPIIGNCGWLLYRSRADRFLFEFLEELLRYLDLDRGLVDGKYKKLYVLVAANLHCRTKFQEAINIQEQVLEINRQTLAEDHPDQLSSQHVLASAYSDNGQVQKAISLLEHVVEMREQTLAENHPSRLASQHELAMAYRNNGQVQDAIPLLEHVAKIQEQTLVEEHPYRLASQHELASAYRNNGQVQKAISLLEHVVEIHKQTLAEDHPDRLLSQHNLAVYYWDDGRPNDAIQLMQHVVEVKTRVLDKDRPDRKISEDWLEIFKSQTGQSSSAQTNKQFSLKVKTSQVDSLSETGGRGSGES